MTNVVKLTPSQLRLPCMVEIANQYGNTVVRPVGEVAKTFASIAGTKTLTAATLLDIRKLGFQIMIESGGAGQGYAALNRFMGIEGPDELQRRQDALDAFERAAESDNPDWHAAAIELRRALMSHAPARIRPPKTIKIAPPPWPDYPVDQASSFKILNPTITVTFADGEVVRAPAVSLPGKPTNIGRGLRVAIAFYCRRRAWRSRIPDRPGYRAEVPAIEACSCDATGETWNAELCTMNTAEARAAQDWRLREAAVQKRKGR